MSFHTGQIVERIGGEDLLKLGLNLPPLRKPVTVGNVYIAPTGEQVLEIVEYPAPGFTIPHPNIRGATVTCYPGFRAIFFRPVVAKKTDISIFTRMLTDARIIERV